MADDGLLTDPSSEHAADVPAVGPLPALLAGLAAALLAWTGGEWAERNLSPAIASEFVVSGGQQFAARAASLARKAMVANGLLGAALGLGLGILGGRARRSVRVSILGGLSGLALGGLAGSAASALLVPWFVRNERPLADDLVLPLLMHGGTAGVLGAACGLALGLGLGGPVARTARIALGGVLGGVVGAALYQVLGAVFFATEQTAQPIATGIGSRLLGRVLVALAVASVAVVASQPTRTPYKSR